MTEHHLEFLSLKGGCTGSSESTLVKMPHCWKSHVVAHLVIRMLIASQVIKKSDSDQVTVIGCCVTIVEALKAAEQLAADNVNIRIIDPFTLKPLDSETIIANAKETGGRIITVEDHYEWGMYIENTR